MPHVMRNSQQTRTHSIWRTVETPTPEQNKKYGILFLISHESAWKNVLQKETDRTRERAREKTLE